MCHELLLELYVYLIPTGTREDGLCLSHSACEEGELGELDEGLRAPPGGRGIVPGAQGISPEALLSATGCTAVTVVRARD